MEPDIAAPLPRSTTESHYMGAAHDNMVGALGQIKVRPLFRSKRFCDLLQRPFHHERSSRRKDQHFPFGRFIMFHAYLNHLLFLSPSYRSLLSLVTGYESKP